MALDDFLRQPDWRGGRRGSTVCSYRSRRWGADHVARASSVEGGVGVGAGRWAGALLGCALLLAACSSDEGAAPDTTSSTTTTAPEESSTTTTASTSSTSSSSTSTSLASTAPPTTADPRVTVESAVRAAVDLAVADFSACRCRRLRCCWCRATSAPRTALRRRHASRALRSCSGGRARCWSRIPTSSSGRTGGVRPDRSAEAS